MSASRTRSACMLLILGISIILTSIIYKRKLNHSRYIERGYINEYDPRLHNRHNHTR